MISISLAQVEATAREVTGGAEVLRSLEKRIAAALLQARAEGYREGAGDVEQAWRELLEERLDDCTPRVDQKADEYEEQATILRGA